MSHEYLIDLHLKEQQKQKNDPMRYKLQILSFGTEDLYLEDSPELLINWITAFAITVLQTKPIVSPEDPIFIRINLEHSHYVKYLWTAFMVLGMTLPDQQFDEQSIKFGPNDSHQDNGLMYNFNPNLEIGLSSRFSSNSLYETEFKKYLDKNRVIHFLTLGQSLHNNLIDLYLTEQQKRKNDPASYDRNVALFVSTVTVEKFTRESSEVLVNFTIALAMKLIIKHMQSLGTPIHPQMFINIYREHAPLMKYLWSSIMLLSIMLPDEEFDESVVQHDLHHENELTSELDSHVAIWTSSFFEPNALYETEYKRYLNKNRVDYFLTNSPIKIAQAGIQKQDAHSAVLPSKEKNKTTYHTKPPESAPLFKPHTTIKSTTLNRAAEKKSLGTFAIAKKLIPDELQSDDKEEMFLLAQFHQLDHIGLKKDLNLSFDYYIRAACLGHPEALTLLEQLGEEMGTEKQLELSQLYATCFHNDEKAEYWRAQAAEIDDLKFNM